MSYKIFINPGHAPNADPDPGAIGNGLQEADVTAAIGQELQKQLEFRGYEVAMLQHDDLQVVCDTANNFNADIFISIHCDSFGLDTAHGTSVFWYRDSSKGGKLGALILKKIVDKLGTAERSNHDGSTFYVCKHTYMPAVLVETAFISNPEDAILLKNKQPEFAEAIADAIDDYFA